ncbi:MAG: flagellar biosynthetic protein FliR [Rhizobiales bacterium]|nr:flagellar biosynthetic protein FliR [Hyphomicrobiales bacterium]
MADLPTSHDVFGIFLIFVRIGAALMLMPGFSEPYIFSRSRLLFALVLSVVLAAPVAPHLPLLPQTLAGLVLLIVGEALLGLFLGVATRIMFAALHVAGSTIAVQSGLATASVFDPSQSTQGTLPGNFLTTVAMVLLFVTDGHHMLLRGLAESYAHLGAGTVLPIADMAGFITDIVQKGFDLGVQMAAPLLLVGLLTNLAMGILNRLMPSFQVFFIALPLQLLLSFATLMLSFAIGLLVFFTFLETEYSTLTLGG